MTEFTMALPVLIAFAISVVLGPIVIPYLRKLKMGQTERVEGVQSHLKKAGTPTMVDYFSFVHSSDFPDLRERLPKDYSNPVSYLGIWYYWIFG